MMDFSQLVESISGHDGASHISHSDAKARVPDSHSAGDQMRSTAAGTTDRKPGDGNTGANK
jgi:hypothetical protein